MRPDDPEMRPFALYVRWMGPLQPNGTGGYAVTQLFRDAQLSRAGNWNYSVRPFQRRLYRWKTAREALDVAKRHVNSVKVNGRTYAEWVQLHLDEEEGQTA
jgi:hypothetical protein